MRYDERNKEIKVTEMENLEINYKMSGSGIPTLLFVHGFNCALEDWAPQVAYLSPKFKCVVMDLPGHGGSPLAGRRTMAALTTAINEVKRQTASGKVVLVGHSLGVRLVMDAYLQSPEDVEGLILVDGRFYDGQPEEISKRLSDLIDEAGFAAFMQRSFARMFVESSASEVIAHVLQRAARIDPEFGREIFLESILWDSTRGRATLKRIEVPVLLLQSTDVDADRRMTSLQENSQTQYMQLVAELVRESTVKAVAGAGHFTMLDAADTVNREIEKFVVQILGG
jgi:pimeloyl-ACP methyl ester carboxylesterase